MSKERIVSVGGGTGTPITNDALHYAGVPWIESVVAPFDNGGATGRRRLDSFGKEIAYSDGMRTLFSLVHPNERDSKEYQTLFKIFNSRQNGKVLGQAIINHFFDPESGFSATENQLRDLGLNLRGHVYPSSTESSNISFVTQSGGVYLGENELDNLRMQDDMVVHMVLDPSVSAFTPAAEAIKKAEIIYLAFGSLHGSVFPNFLPEGMRKAVAESQAQIILTTNLLSTRNETHNFTPIDYVQVATKYIGRKPNALIVPEETREFFERENPEVADSYRRDGSFFLGWEQTKLNEASDQGVKIVTHRATKLVTVESGRKIVRHDPQKLSDALGTLLSA